MKVRNMNCPLEAMSLLKDISLLNVLLLSGIKQNAILQNVLVMSGIKHYVSLLKVLLLS